MAYRLTANKTKLYKLAKQYYPEIEIMRKAEFIKYPRSRSYALDFRSGSYFHHLFFSVCGGQPLLGDSWSTEDDDGNKTSYWETHKLTLAELQEYGLLESY